MFSSSEEFRTDMTCHLNIDTQSPGWYRTINKVLRKIKGVSYSIDAEKGLAYITGRVNPNKLLREIAKAEKYAELCWVQTGSQNIMNPYGNGYQYHPQPGYAMTHYHPQQQQQPSQCYGYGPYAYPKWA